VALDAVQAPALVQLLHGDGLGGVQAALVDPALDAVEVDGRHVDGEGVVLAAAALRVGDGLGRLAALEAGGHLAVGMLTLLTTSCRLSLARGGTATAPDLLIVGARVVRQRRQDRRASLRRGDGELDGGGPRTGGEERRGEADDLEPGRHGGGWRAESGRRCGGGVVVVALREEFEIPGYAAARPLWAISPDHPPTCVHR
jgi:hypothetical protein